MSIDLHISLGHNSSAVVAVDGAIASGYEQERFDRKKSSSAYPIDAIYAAMRDASTTHIPYADTAYVSHWFDDFKFSSNKYVDLDHLRSVARNVVSLTPEFTHHDAHASSAINFLRGHEAIDRPWYVVVVDGFGNNQECFSFYEHEAGANTLRHRTYGYDVSLGLMYQYVTEYLGLRPNQDEYKLLGYESHVCEYVSPDCALTIRDAVRDEADVHADRMLSRVARPLPAGTPINREGLQRARARWHAQAHSWRQRFPDDLDETGVRCAVAFCAQAFIERAVSHLLDALTGDDPTRPVLLTGGCFYNVKLNRSVALRRHAQVVSHPLAGDQGAALGFTRLPYAGLDWGGRDIGRASRYPAGMTAVDEAGWVAAVAALLERNAIVNVVRGRMEYGPRALCNTTTFAHPTRANVARINALNDRDEAMPMAPVMTRAAAAKLLRADELEKIGPSAMYMITTCRFDSPPSSSLLGVAHGDPLRQTVFTARPQVALADDLVALLSTTLGQTLINTSFNYHGQPIVRSEADAIATHAMQTLRAATLGVDGPYTLMVRP